MYNELTKNDIKKMEEEIEYRKLVVRKEAIEAVKEARAAAQPGDIVVLSPACAAFDRFKNFMERGQVFKELVREL